MGFGPLSEPIYTLTGEDIPEGRPSSLRVKIIYIFLHFHDVMFCAINHDILELLVIYYIALLYIILLYYSLKL